jgi:uncharacterized protein (DUF302 family)
MSHNTEDSPIMTKISAHSVSDTVAHFTAILDAKGVKTFAVIDQRAEAEHVGLELRETVLVIFGSPKAGTPVMAAAPYSALDLPLKVLIWDDGGRTKVSYTSPDELTRRYELSADLSANLAAINALTTALVSA